MENLDFARLRYEGENHPYTGHPAARSSMPELYYLLLMTILTSAEANEAQWMHLYRVAKGAGYAQDVRELLPSAHSITGEKIVECAENIRRDNLTNAFLLDAMLLYLLREEENAKLLEYIAGLCALMGMSPQLIKDNMQIAKYIILQDLDRYLALIVNDILTNPVESAFYFKQLIFNLEAASSIEREHLIILCTHMENTILSLDKWKSPHISFLMCDFDNVSIESKKKTIQFFKCSFQNTIPQKCLDLNGCSIKKCHFINCKMSRQSEFIHLVNGKVIDTLFEDCINEVDIGNSSNIFVENTNITECKFSRCMSITADASGHTSIISAKKSTIEHCTFDACECSAPIFLPFAHWASILYLQNSSQAQNLFQNCIYNDEVYEF